jgi:hypothetical protein
MTIETNLKQKRQNQCLIGGIVLLLIWIVPLSAFCQKASIKDVNVKGAIGAWKVSFDVENCFTEKMEEAIQSGIRTTFTFYIDLYQKRSWWKDRKVASYKFHHTVRYHLIQKVYQVTLEEDHSSPVASSLEEAKKLMSKVKGFEIQPSSPFKPGIPTYFRIMAELDPVRLPLHLEYLFFFVSLWDFETDWHIEPLPP